MEDKVLAIREQVYFLDKLALKMSCIERIIEKPDVTNI